MPDPILSLDHHQVRVAPGSQASLKITVRSTSTRVEGFKMQVLGSPPNRWAEVNPPEIDVYPGEESTATVIFSPPSGTQTLSGSFPFGVRAQATESADDSAVVEGDVEVGEVDGLQTKLVPVTATGRWLGRHVLQVSNQSNTAAEYHLEASDPDDLLNIMINPQRVDLDVGEEQAVRVTVRPKRPILLGAPTRVPFQITGEPLVSPTGGHNALYGAPGRLSVDGALMQRPVFTLLRLIIAGILILLLVAGIVWVRLHPVDKTVQLANIASTEAPAPLGVSARAISSNKIRISWPQSLQQITGYEIVTRSTHRLVRRVAWDQKSADVTSRPTNEGTKVLDAGKQYCFQLRGVRYEKVGRPSAVVCARTKEKPATVPSKYRYWLIAESYPKATVDKSAQKTAVTDPTVPASASSAPTVTSAEPVSDSATTSQTTTSASGTTTADPSSTASRTTGATESARTDATDAPRAGQRGPSTAPSATPAEPTASATFAAPTSTGAERTTAPPTATADSDLKTATTAASPAVGQSTTESTVVAVDGGGSIAPTIDDTKSLKKATMKLNDLISNGFTSTQIIDTEAAPYTKIEILGGRKAGDTTWAKPAVPTWLISVGQFDQFDGDLLRTSCYRLQGYLDTLHTKKAACTVARTPV